MRHRSLQAFAILLVLTASPSSRADGETPCSAPEYRQFDFWIGTWEVAKPDGTAVGENRIEAILGGCALQESWRGSRGLEGRSLNAWDAPAGVWRQSWVDGGGTVLELSGGLRDGRMVLEGERPRADGRSVLHRIAWQPLENGAVRQHWQSSQDDGASWADVFVGIYSKRGG